MAKVCRGLGPLCSKADVLMRPQGARGWGEHSILHLTCGGLHSPQSANPPGQVFPKGAHLPSGRKVRRGPQRGGWVAGEVGRASSPDEAPSAHGPALNTKKTFLAKDFFQRLF